MVNRTLLAAEYQREVWDEVYSDDRGDGCSALSRQSFDGLQVDRARGYQLHSAPRIGKAADHSILDATATSIRNGSPHIYEGNGGSREQLRHGFTSASTERGRRILCRASFYRASVV
jgi:hypothetical protein